MTRHWSHACDWRLPVKLKRGFIMNAEKTQNQLLASLHVTVWCLHQYFDALAAFQSELMASKNISSSMPPSPDHLEQLLTQYLARHFDSAGHDHRDIDCEPSEPADLLPLLAKIFTSFQERSGTWDLLNKLTENNDFD